MILIIIRNILKFIQWKTYQFKIFILAYVVKTIKVITDIYLILILWQNKLGLIYSEKKCITITSQKLVKQKWKKTFFFRNLTRNTSLYTAILYFASFFIEIIIFKKQEKKVVSSSFNEAIRDALGMFSAAHCAFLVPNGKKIISI